MSVIQADLVGPLPEGKNSRNQRGFQYILSVVDSATRYLWLLPMHHKTTECVAATLVDEVISRVSVPSSIVTDQGGEFTGEVVECLLKRLGITHLCTSAYHPQTDAKCERAHFSVHNMITKMIADKHDRWPDLLGSVALAYNATIHTSTGYSSTPTPLHLQGGPFQATAPRPHRWAHCATLRGGEVGMSVCMRVV